MSGSPVIEGFNGHENRSRMADFSLQRPSQLLQTFALRYLNIFPFFPLQRTLVMIVLITRSLIACPFLWAPHYLPDHNDQAQPPMTTTIALLAGISGWDETMALRVR